MKIEVKDCKYSENIIVTLKGAPFSADAIDKPYILFWLNDDEADKLSFQLNSVLQDRERRKNK